MKKAKLECFGNYPKEGSPKCRACSFHVACKKGEKEQPPKGSKK